MRRFLAFLPASGTRYRIHSPFLYDLVDTVIVKSGMQGELRPVERLRQKYLRDRQAIIKTDYGKGSGSKDYVTYSIPVSRLARTSLTTRRHALRLYHLARYLKASRILEMGTSLGFTTAYLAKANAKAQVVSLEGCPVLSGIARKNLEELGVRNTEIIQGRFEDRIGDALDRLGELDLVFLDGDHRKESVLANFERCRPYLHNNSVVVIDDIHYSRGMEEAWEIIISRGDVTVSLDFFHSGWIFFRKESSKEHFRLRYL